jgi:hypothetical protein
MNKFDIYFKDHTSFLENEYVAGAISIFLIAYAGLAAPKLPNYIAKLFDYTFIKLFMFFMIVYISKKNATVAIIASIAVLVSIMTLNKLKLAESMMSVSINRQLPSGDLNNCNCNCNNMGAMGNYKDCKCDCHNNGLIPVVQQVKPETNKNSLEHLVNEAKKRITNIESNKYAVIDDNKQICKDVLDDFKNDTSNVKGFDGITSFANL